jgi:hypothetical protein
MGVILNVFIPQSFIRHYVIQDKIELISLHEKKTLSFFLAIKIPVGSYHFCVKASQLDDFDDSIPSTVVVLLLMMVWIHWLSLERHMARPI